MPAPTPIPATSPKVRDCPIAFIVHIPMFAGSVHVVPDHRRMSLLRCTRLPNVGRPVLPSRLPFHPAIENEIANGSPPGRRSRISGGRKLNSMSAPSTEAPVHAVFGYPGRYAARTDSPVSSHWAYRTPPPLRRTHSVPTAK